MMEWVIAALAVVILGLAALAAAGRFGSMPEADDDVYAPVLPEGRLTAADLRDMRFGVALRGYDMRQVDALLRRLADQLSAEPAAELEAEREELAVVETVAPTDDEGPSADDPALSEEPLLVADPVDETLTSGQTISEKASDVADDQPDGSPVWNNESSHVEEK